MKKRKTGFESFAQVFLIVTIVVFVFGIIMVKSVESSYNRTIQKLQNEIDTLDKPNISASSCCFNPFFILNSFILLPIILN